MSAATLPEELRQALDALAPGALVALDGRCAAGKTTLAQQIQQAYPGTLVVHMDDFYVPAQQKTPERMAVPGNNVDWERFDRQVLTPLCAGQSFQYQPFDCHTQSLRPACQLQPGRLNIVEGSYSCHPALRQRYALRVFLDVDSGKQLRRIQLRGGPQALAAFQERWIPLEEAYFAACEVQACCQLTLQLG